ncbi:hypothetical protein KVH31_34740 [Streptomyces olivaceus]|uniref:hypothetical protein n=1 Tax=Streptomyces olivaceus TaxID=47716 RepID=UPI001CC8F46F|nr:hypothetical protein [Streptomyces olivaceus]MBZ6211656.1 hypothetical protein [Streptomyces olivaceus]
MRNSDAGHSHGPTPHLVTGCPLCDHQRTVRNQAIAHLAEAIHLLSLINPSGATPTIRLNLAPINLTGDDVHNCHSVDLTAKQAETVADATDSVNAYAGSQPPPVDALPAVTREQIPTGDYSAAAVAQNEPDLYAEVTDLFLLVDPESYLDDVFSSPDPHESMNAYEQLVTGEWDGDL